MVGSTRHHERGGMVMVRRKVAEIAELSSPEELSKIAEEAMRMMGSDDELERLEAQGMLDSSKCVARVWDCLLYTSPSPRDGLLSRMPSSA